MLEKGRSGIAQIWFARETKCLLCGKENESVCIKCRIKYFQYSILRCKMCGKLLTEERELCRDCREGRGPAGLSRVAVLGQYTGDWKKFIHKIKFKGQPYLILEVADYAVEMVVKMLPPPDGVVPVPMCRKKVVERGFNQAEVLSSVLSWRLGITYMPVLERIKDTAPQVGLKRGERLENIKNAFEYSFSPKGITGKILLLIDDVTTTGATLAECAKILHKNGAKEVFAFCLAAGKEELK
ncbi:MAG: phosphoribosyltransferase family protein [Eubacteriales bacterium]